MSSRQSSIASRIFASASSTVFLAIATLDRRPADNIPAVVLVALQKHLEIERVHEAIVFSPTGMSNCYVPTAGIA
jgi:hypothetical protein